MVDETTNRASLILGKALHAPPPPRLRLGAARFLELLVSTLNFRALPAGYPWPGAPGMPLANLLCVYVFDADGFSARQVCQEVEAGEACFRAEVLFRELL